MWLTPLFIAFLGGSLGVADKLLGDDRRARLIGLLSLVVLISGLVWQGFSQYLEIRSVERLEVFTHSGLDYLDEASGGVYDPATERAYLVDDDESKLFVLAFKKDENRYALTSEMSLFDEYGAKLNNSDLEAIALYDKKLYAMASHSNKQSGVEKAKRQRLLEITIVSPQAGRVNRSANLRSAILEHFKIGVPGLDAVLHPAPRDEEELREVMNIEGFAISPEGQAYIGFRSPLVNGRYALVLMAGLEDLFGPDPQFEATLLDLQFDGHHYAITELAFDLNGRDVLIIGNSRRRFEFFSPVLWRWRPEPGPDIQLVERLKDGFMVPPWLFRAKPEAMVVSPAGSIGVFADAEGYGGQRVYDRTALGLE